MVSIVGSKENKGLKTEQKGKLTDVEKNKKQRDNLLIFLRNNVGYLDDIYKSQTSTYLYTNTYVTGAKVLALHMTEPVLTSTIICSSLNPE